MDLRDYSKYLESIIEVTPLSKGGEAAVYRIEHSGNEELVVKTTLSGCSMSDIENAVNESHLIQYLISKQDKHLNQDYVA